MKITNTIAVMGVLLLAAPHVLIAAQPTSSSTTKKVATCSELSLSKPKLSPRFPDRQIETGRSQIDLERERYVNEAGKEKKRQFTDFVALVKDAQEKSALIEFQSAVASATEHRSQKIDQALDAYRSALDEKLALRKHEVLSAVDVFNMHTDEAIKRAKDECARGAKVSVVQATYDAQLKVLREVLKEDQKKTSVTFHNLYALREVRNRTIEAADNEFAVAIEAAKKTYTLRR
jgi:hypothetical protein